MRPKEKPRKPKEPKLHKLANQFSGMIIFFIVIFSPWAFGTTENWSIWIVNLSAYALGFLLLSKGIIRWGLRNKLQTKHNENKFNTNQNNLIFIQNTFNLLLVCSMIFLLAYILTSATNARASFNIETKNYTYFSNFNAQLPHSYDANATWLLFWQYLGLIIIFWSMTQIRL